MVLVGVRDPNIDDQGDCTLVESLDYKCTPAQQIGRDQYSFVLFPEVDNHLLSLIMEQITVEFGYIMKN